MELKVDVNELRKKKLFVATPCYGGMCNGLYAKSCLDLQAICYRYGIDVKFSMLFNESLITRARAYMSDEFIRSDFTHFLFIDSDIHFDPQHVITLLAMDLDISGAPYPKKSINWNNIKKAVERAYVHHQEWKKANPKATPDEIKAAEMDAGMLQRLVGEYVFNPVAGTQNFQVTEPLEVMEIGTGFMMIKRNVLDKFKEAYPTLAYKPDHAGQPNFDGSRYIHMYFDTFIDRTDSLVGGGSDRYLSEDYAFCQLCRKIGFKLWLMPWMRLGHVGSYEFNGDLTAVANLVGSL